MRSHDNGDGTNALCFSEDCIGRVAGLDKKTGCATLNGVRRKECVQMRERRPFVIALRHEVFLEEMRTVGRYNVQRE